MSVPKIINNDDFLGRAILSSESEKRAIKGKIDFRIFFYEKNNSLSVDRFGFCQKKELTNIQDKNANLRSQKESIKRTFYGWASVTAEIARRNRRTVQSTPTGDNPYHADIYLPKEIERDGKKAHAKELASNSDWIPRFNE